MRHASVLRPLVQAAEPVQSFALAQLLRWTWRPASDLVGGRGDFRFLRTALELGMRLTPPQLGVTHTSVRITDPHHDDHADHEDRDGGLPAEWSTPQHATDGSAVLYLHGGAFAFGSARTHRMLTGALAAESGLRVLAPSYRLAPEHPAPAALDDARAAFRFLEQQGVPAERIVVAGDSAGAYLAALLAADRREARLPAPAAVVLLSPWLDPECVSLRAADRRLRDPVISPRAAERFGRLYVGSDQQHATQLCLAVPEEDAERYGPGAPYLIQVGGLESLAPEVQAFSERLARTGVECAFEIWPGQVHVFQAMHPYLPAARRALHRAGQFAREHTAVPTKGATR